MKQIFSLLALISIITACNQKPKTGENAIAEDTTVVTPIAELTYVEIWRMLLKVNDAAGRDVHGEVFGTDAMGDVSLRIGEVCTDGCGDQMNAVNSSDQAVRAIVLFTFDFPGNPIKEMKREYLIPADGQMLTGCTNFCYNGDTYSINRKIESAGYDLIE